MPGTSSVRWGVLGTANIAVKSVIPALFASEKNELVAIGSRDAARGQAVASQLGIPRAHASYDDLLADDAVEAVYIPLPNGLHTEWTVRAARAGKHVLCEKPMALGLDECRRMLDACREAGVLFMEALMYRLHPQHARVRDLLDSGLLGEPTLFRASFCFSMRNPRDNVRLVPELGGGALLDLGVYAIDSARFVLGAEPTDVAGRVRIDPRFGVDMTGAGVLTLPRGTIAEVSASFEAAGGGHYELIGTGGRVVVEDAYALGNGRPCRVRWQAGGREGEERFPAIDQYRLEVDAFADAVRGRAPLPFPSDAGVGNIAVIERLLAT